MLNPVFSINHMREMSKSPSFQNLACFSDVRSPSFLRGHRQGPYLPPDYSYITLITTYQLKRVLVKKVETGPQEIDILHWMTRTALELIGQSGMGYSFDSLEDDNDYHPYSRSVKRFV